MMVKNTTAIASQTIISKVNIQFFTFEIKGALQFSRQNFLKAMKCSNVKRKLITI